MENRYECNGKAIVLSIPVLGPFPLTIEAKYVSSIIDEGTEGSVLRLDERLDFTSVRIDVTASELDAQVEAAGGSVIA